MSQFPNHDRGQLYVNRFVEACESLMKEGAIKNIVVWPKYSRQDKSGVDLTIELPDSKHVNFQITSSLTSAQRHREVNMRYPERPKVEIIYIREGNRPVMKSVPNIRKEILGKICKPNNEETKSN